MNVTAADAGPAEDAALTRAAQAGDVSALALLLERHRPGMRAVALSLLGPGPDVDDVLQEAALTALRRIVDIRDPDAVGPWLRMVVRNNCRTVLRTSQRVEPYESVPPPLLPAGVHPGVVTPEQVLQGHALRDWIWEAVDSLSPTVRLPLVLRHFSTGITSYQQIADACALPVRTVRSRLHQARGALAQALAATAETRHEDAARRTANSWHEARETLAAAERGEFAKVVRDRYSPGVSLFAGGERLGGQDQLLAGMNSDLSAGVRQRPLNVIAGRRLVVWEMELIGPPDNPDHCPPGVAWILSLRDGRFDRVALYHSSRPTADAPSV